MGEWKDPLRIVISAVEQLLDETRAPRIFWLQGRQLVCHHGNDCHKGQAGFAKMRHDSGVVTLLDAHFVSCDDGP